MHDLASPAGLGGASNDDVEVLAISAPGPGTDALAAGVRWDRHIAVPTDQAADVASWCAALERWRAEARATTPRSSHIVVSALVAHAAPVALDDALDPEAWEHAFTRRLLAGFAALQLAADLCADGGAIVCVVDDPPWLDAAGHLALAGLAEALATAARSVALTHGPRGVRVNTVTSAVTSAPPDTAALPGAPPPFASYPGTIGDDVAGAVRMMLTDDAVGVTGTVVRADGGRSWG